MNTFINPINISYQYQKGTASRSSADCCAIVFKGAYWLFASKGSGYWRSDDLVNWAFIQCRMPEINFWAPAIFEYGGYLYITHFDGGIWKSANPETGEWSFVSHPRNWADPAILVDDTRIYCYFGCSDKDPIAVVELDPENNMAVMGEPVALICENKAAHGFEVSGDNNELLSRHCFMEGAWVTKHRGRYYLQYAAPGTQFASYADGCYVSDSPTGPFSYCAHSPISYKPDGFLPGAGHGSLLQDTQGNWWKFNTAVIAANDGFERRLVMAPAKFDESGRLITNCIRADYPLYTPHSKLGCFDSPGPDWHLISYKPVAAASSSLPGHEPGLAFNESIRTWWSAETGNGGEWLQADLGKLCGIYAIHVNFADQDADKGADGRDHNWCYRYLLEASADGDNWVTIMDRSDFTVKRFEARDTSHEYIELPAPIHARFLKLTNRGSVPAGGTFAVSGLRAFGNGGGDPPSIPAGVRATRGEDIRTAVVSWHPVEAAEGYILRFGTSPDCLNLHRQIIGDTSIELRCLNAGVSYWFTVDAYNDSGYAKNVSTIYMP